MNALKWDKDFALEQTAGDQDLLQELVEIFKETSVTDLSKIQESIGKQDVAMCRLSCHSIKGAAASLGFQGLRELTASMEADCREGSLAMLTDRISELEKLVKLLKIL